MNQEAQIFTPLQFICICPHGGGCCQELQEAGEVDGEESRACSQTHLDLNSDLPILYLYDPGPVSTSRASGPLVVRWGK